MKTLAGNPGKRALPKHEPKPAGNLAAPPAWMTESQKAGWLYAMTNAPRGLLKKLDRGILATWVVAEDLHREAAVELAKGGLLTTTEKGNKIQSPYLPIVNRQALIMLRAADHLGFSPASRPRISAPLNTLPPIDDPAEQQTEGEMPAEDDDLDGYLAGNPARLN